MHRMPYGRQQEPSDNRPVVFLMHGLFGASNGYIAREPEYGIAYNLVDAGFDCWLGNARGNRLSRYHVSLDPDDSADKQEFFNFSWEEIGMIDVAAMIDYVLAYTGNEKLHYIGHSQGGTAFLVLASMRPEYNEKILSAHLLAGVGHMEFFPDTALSGLASMTTVIYTMALGMGIVELFPPNSTNGIWRNTEFPQRLSDLCTGDIEDKDLCHQMGINRLLRNGTEDEEDDEQSIFDNWEFDYEPAGAALKQVAHYGQNIRDKQFRRWSYGTLQNLANYGSANPPLYNLSLITINTTMHYSLNDDLLDERDVLSMVELMPNTVARKVERDSFTHEEYVYADDAKELVTDFIIESIWSHEPERAEAIAESAVADSASSENSSSHITISSTMHLYLFIYGIRVFFYVNV